MNNIKLPLVSILLFFTLAFCQGQNIEFSPVIYANGEMERVNFEYPIDSGLITSKEGWKIGGFNPAVRYWSNNQNFQELEISHFQIWKTTTSVQLSPGSSSIEYQKLELVTPFKLGLNYEYNYSFFKQKDYSWKTSLGVFLHNRIRQDRLENLQSHSESRLIHWDINTGIVPRLTWFPSPHIWIELNTSISLYNAQLGNVRFKTNGKEDTRTGTFSLNALPNYHRIRLGIGYKF